MSLLENATPEELAQAAELYPATWVLQHEIKQENGLPIDFDKRPYLWDIYNDLSPKQVILKPPQVGMTVAMTLKSLWVAKKLKRQIIYTLPTQSDVQAMVGGSFNRIIAQNPILMEWVKDHDTVEQKSVGDSMIFYRGTFTQKQAMMIPSGLNIHDEVDASDGEIIVQYENRLQAQEDGGWRWYFSHPSLTGFGVDNYWQQSDQKEWYIMCNGCKEKQQLRWPDSIRVPQSGEEAAYVCVSCKRELTDQERINGEWVKTGTGEFSGYHISQLMLYNKSAKDIIDAYNDPLKDKQYFWNYVLGLPYADSEDKISPDQVLRNVSTLVNDQSKRPVIGVDTGLPIYFTVANQDGFFYYGTCPDVDPYKHLERYLQKWPNAILVSDQGGDLIGIRELQAKYPGRVFLCYYRKDKKSIKMIEWGEGDEFGKVHVDRNRMIQLIVEMLRDVGRLRLNGSREDWAPFAKQFDNIYRERIKVKQSPDKDDKTLYGSEFVWKRTGPDHWVHAMLYTLVGLDKFGVQNAQVVGPDVFDELQVGRVFE